MNPLLLTDFYKVHHHQMYPENTTMIYSNFTPRKSRIKGVNQVVVFGTQHFIKKYLLGKFNTDFFQRPLEEVITEYKFAIDVDTSHIKALHKLGYLPIRIKALKEGTLCPIGVPMLTIVNTKPEFYWLTNYLETLISTQLWQPITSATIAYEYKKLLTKYALETTGSADFVTWQGHDFSMRGMSSVESGILSGMGHLLSFTGTDSIPAIYALKNSYGASGLIGASVPATEHSVMCMGEKESEIETFKRLMTIYPTGILSVVSDTWDLWKVLTEYLPQLKKEILTRDGKLVIRPDSGDPVDIICGIDIPKYATITEAMEDFQDQLGDNTIHGEQGFTIPNEILVEVNGHYFKLTESTEWNRYDKQYYFIETIDINAEEVDFHPKYKGVIELLWETFGGTINEKGYKVLDGHIGAIYGDSISLERAEQICQRLKDKGFASTNIVFGIGSYTYQYNTRDTFGFAMKATYGEVEQQVCCNCPDEQGPSCCGDPNWESIGREIFKDPITDDGTKKSKKGLLQVYEISNPHIPIEDNGLFCKDQCTWEQEQGGLLEIIFEDGKLLNETTLDEIRLRLVA